MSAPTLTVVLMGVAGTGKTTVGRGIAGRLGWRMAEGDDFHPASNVEKMRGGTPLTDQDRWPWLARIADWIGECEAAGVSAAVSCSALKRCYRDVLRAGHPSVQFCHLTASAGQLTERLAQRTDHYMPASLLASQLATLEPLGPDEPGVTVPHDGDPEQVLSACLAALGLPRELRLSQAPQQAHEPRQAHPPRQAGSR